MQKLKYLIITSPLLLIFGIWKFQSLDTSTVREPISRLTPKILGKWIVGKHENLNDQDTLLLQEALDHSLNGDTILLRPGNYALKSLPTKKITIRGLTSDPDKVFVTISKTIMIKSSPVVLENISLINLTKQESGIIVDGGKLYADNIKVKFSQTKKDFYLKSGGLFVSKNNQFVGTKLNTSIFISGKSKLRAENNKFIKFKNAIETHHGKFQGEINLDKIEISYCLSSGIYLHGGKLYGANLNISKSASGAIIAGQAIATLDQVSMSNNRNFAIDVVNGGRVNLDLFQFKNNINGGIRAFGEKSHVVALNGQISGSKIALVSANEAIITAKGLSLADNLQGASKITSRGQIRLGK